MTGDNSTFVSSGGKGNFIPFQGLFQSRVLWTRFFTGQIRPEIAIVPVGWRNSLKLPNPQVLERYRNAGSNLLRTDLDGTVCVEINGDEISVDTYEAHNL